MKGLLIDHFYHLSIVRRLFYNFRFYGKTHRLKTATVVLQLLLQVIDGAILLSNPIIECLQQVFLISQADLKILYLLLQLRIIWGGTHGIRAYRCHISGAV